MKKISTLFVITVIVFSFHISSAGNFATAKLTEYTGDLRTTDFPRGLTIGDVNGDGSDDLVWVSHEGITYVSYSNNFTNNLKATQFHGDLATVEFPRGLAVGDINGDKIDDMVWVSHDGITYYALGEEVNVPVCNAANVGAHHPETNQICTAITKTFYGDEISYIHKDNNVSYPLYENDTNTRHNFCMYKKYLEWSGNYDRDYTTSGPHIKINGIFPEISTDLVNPSGWYLTELQCRKYDWQ